ncbi:methyltransferase family protein [Halorhodospira halochloris]|uniref:methyltransferase family protein n=1 Tax=Halorhodospira halochloris TaxID=1052 RepID=UPI001EE86DD4|nr:isoprenylcysteine carboxylmethyltransferase family protein [Halorhodospira halochloris]MCG5547274.1 isoprenylcysteine carboxylmethyltransferase family protein [Halorhodospira halochloris]
MNLDPKSLVESLTTKRHKARQALGILLLILTVVVSAPQSASLFVVGTILAGIGIMIRLWGAGHLKKDKELAQDGPYAFVRHPLYVGNTLIITGYLAAAQIWWLVPIAIAFGLLYYPPAIRKEDSKLRKRFPEQWEAWGTKTHALIPKLQPEGELNIHNWSFSQSLRANGEPIIAAFLILGLVVMGSRIFG